MRPRRPFSTRAARFKGRPDLSLRRRMPAMADLASRWVVRLTAAGLSASLLTTALAARQETSPPASGQRLDWSSDDGKRIATLESTGVRTEGKWAVVWTPAGALEDAERATMIERIDKGVAALRKLIGVHPWQAVRNQRIRYYISDDAFVSHAVGGTEVVLVPLARVKDGRAPFIHEAAHSLLGRVVPPDVPPLDGESRDRLQASRPNWLAEGIAEYFGKSAARLAGVVDGDPFDSGGLEGMDRTCAERSAKPPGERVLPYIGALGAPAELFTTERPKYAPIFYPCSFSFTKHVAKLIGDHELIGLMDLMSRVDRSTTPITMTPDGVLPRIETLTGKTRGQIRADWLGTLPKP